MRPGKADDANYQRRIGEPALLDLDLTMLGIRIFPREHFSDDRAGPRPRVSLEHDEAPRRQLAVVGHARTDGQDCFQLGGRGPRSAHLPRFNRSASFQEVDGVWHGSLSGRGTNSFLVKQIGTIAWHASPGASVLGFGSRPLYIRWGRFIDQGGDGFIGWHHLLSLAAEPPDRNRMRLGFLLADDEKRRDFGQRMFADLVVDLFVAQIDLDAKAGAPRRGCDDLGIRVAL